MIGSDLLPEVKSAGPLRLARGDLSGLDQLAAESVAVFVFSDVRPLRGVAGFLDWRLCGALSRTLEDGLLVGESGEAMLLPSVGRLGRRRLFVFGLGPEGDCSAEAMRRAVRRAFDVMERAGVRDAAVAAPQSSGGEMEAAFVSVVQQEVGARTDRIAAILVEKPAR
jgi:hypothetical protein